MPTDAGSASDQVRLKVTGVVVSTPAYRREFSRDDSPARTDSKP